MKTHPITAVTAALAMVFALLASAPSAGAAPKAPPAQSHAHGDSLGGWLVRYWNWVLGQGPNGGNGHGEGAGGEVNRRSYKANPPNQRPCT